MVHLNNKWTHHHPSLRQLCTIGDRNLPRALHASHRALLEKRSDVIGVSALDVLDVNVDRSTVGL